MAGNKKATPDGSEPVQEITNNLWDNLIIQTEPVEKGDFDGDGDTEVRYSVTLRKRVVETADFVNDNMNYLIMFLIMVIVMIVFMISYIIFKLTRTNKKVITKLRSQTTIENQFAVTDQSSKQALGRRRRKFKAIDEEVIS